MLKDGEIYKSFPKINLKNYQPLLFLLPLKIVMNKKNLVMTIDPGETTGICLVRDNLIIGFQEHKSKNWEDSLNFIADLVQKEKPRVVIYENTSYVHKRIPGTLNLLKLIGGIVGIKFAFDFIEELGGIAVNQVKSLKGKLFSGQEQIKGLACKIGRGKGWKYNSKRISLHQLDALVIYHLWSKGSLESTKSIKKKIAELKAKKRLGIRQKENLEKLERFLLDRKKADKISS